jgi:hypothetical protein
MASRPYYDPANPSFATLQKLRDAVKVRVNRLRIWRVLILKNGSKNKTRTRYTDPCEHNFTETLTMFGNVTWLMSKVSVNITTMSDM